MACNKVILQLGDLLFWKDATILKRRPFVAGTLIILPILICSLPLAMHATRSAMNDAKSPKKILPMGYSSVVNLPKFKDSKSNTVFPSTLLYTPKNGMTQKIMVKAAENLAAWITTEAVDSGKILEDTLKKNEDSHQYLGGVEFSSVKDESTMPKDIRYIIRMYTPRRGSFETQRLYINTARLSFRTRAHDEYLTSGFLSVQVAVERAILQIMCVDDDHNYDVSIKAMFWPKMGTDDFYEYIAVLQPALIVASILIYCITMAKDIVGDKEQRIREKLNMIGVGNFVIWLSYFLKYFILMFISYTVITVLMLSSLSEYKAMLGERTDALLVLLMMLLYFLSSIMFCFALTTLFTSSSNAAFVSAIIYMVSYLPSVSMIFNPGSTSAAVKGFLCIFPNVALTAGFEIITQYLEVKPHLNWDYVNTPVFANQIPFSTVLLMLFADIFIYALLAWYLENVQPGSGLPRPLYFPFTKSYWLGRKASRDHTLIPVSDNLPDLFEENPQGLRIGIQTQGLLKEYVGAFNDTAAVNEMYVDMLQGQVTVVLGPQGAGKTTLVSLLTCTLQPTSGTAFVDGYDITKNPRAVHSAVGCCPQDNIFFDYLTVEENLRFFGRLKGISYKKLKDAVTKMMTMTGLRKNRRTLAMHLPDGQARMLTVAQSLMGDPKVIILDEPTKGMDPSTRHHVWGLLKKMKINKTILVTTEYEDEAEHLGDRIAILANGTLQCCGSADFLKKKYSAGYHLIIRKTKDCRVDSVTAYIQKHMPNALLERSVAEELVFSMPEQDAGMFVELFKDLEQAQAEIGVLGYSVCISSLEEMYFRVVEEDEEDLKNMMLKNAEISKFKQRLSKVLEIGRKMTKFFEIDVEKGAMARRQSRKQTLTGSEKSVKNSVAYTRKQTLVDVKFDQKPEAETEKRISAGSKKSENTENALNTVVAPSDVQLQPTNDNNNIPEPTSTAANEDKVTPTPYPATTEPAHEMTGVNNEVAGENNAEDIANPDPSKNENANPDDDAEVESIGTTRRRTTKQSRPEINVPIGETIKLQLEHLRGLLTKMALHSFRNILGTLLKFILPILVAVAFAIAANLMYPGGGSASSSDALDLNVEQYEIPVVDYNSEGEAGKKYSAAFAKQFDSSMVTSEDVTTKMKNSEYDEHFTRKALLNYWQALRSYILSGHFKEQPNEGLKIDMYYNAEPFHAQPIAFNAIHNSILKAGDNLEDYTLHLTNHPIPTSSKRLVGRGVTATKMRLFVTSAALALASILPALFGMFQIREYTTNARHMQMVSGVRPWVYWASAFIWDFFIYILTISIMAIIFAVLDTPEYAEGRLGILILAFIMFGFAILPLVYLLCHAFDKPVTGFELMIICFGLCSLVPLSIVNAANEYIKSPGFIDFLSTLFQIFIPHYCLGRTIWDMEFRYQENYLAWDVVGSNIFFFFFSGLLYWFAIAVSEMYGKDPAVERCCQAVQCEPRAQVAAHDLPDEDDVQNEMERVLEKDTYADEAIIFQEVSKSYGKKVAVDRLTFGIPNGSCFGLLGMNHTGKTTVFKLLTGQESLTAGSIFIKGYDVTEELYDTRRFIGYCPQDDDYLHSWMTGEEALRFYGRLRGVDESRLPETCKDLIEVLGLDIFCKEQIKTYSVAKRRLLAIAISMVGEPPIILLDNPTSHLDPVSKQNVRNLLTARRVEGSTIFISSHSMAECEELCTTISIIADGMLQCFGSVEHLISKYGKGCSVVIRLKELENETIASDQPAREFMATTFPGSVLIDDDKERLTFQVRDPKMNWAQIHKVMEGAKNQLNMESFYVIQATLAQVFMSFAFHRKKK